MAELAISRRIQQACIWAGPAMGVLFVVGFTVAGFFPPPSPNKSSAEVAAMIDAHRTAIRIGIVICLASCPLLMPFLASFTIQMKRIEGVRPIMAYTQLALGALATIEFVIPYVFMLASTYRADQNPDVTRALYDLGWFFFLGVISTFVLQLVLFGVAVLIDRRTAPIFPRWLGYVNIWLAITFTPASFLVFFKTGPLAWNGAGVVGARRRIPAVVPAELRLPAARRACRHRAGPGRWTARTGDCRPARPPGRAVAGSLSARSCREKEFARWYSKICCATTISAIPISCVC